MDIAEIDLTEMSETESQKQKLIDYLRELDIEIVFEELGDANRIVLNSTDESRSGIKQILLDKTVYARYDFPYLIVQF
jgi:hypothetical protein